MTNPLRPANAPLTNMHLAMRTMMDCREAGPGAPRMGLFYGFSGYGKSVAAAFVAAQTGAIYLQAQSVWTQRSFLETLAGELGITRLDRTVARLMGQIITQLNHSPVDIIIDEMDALVNKRQVEIIRDIYEGSHAAILMIGEEALPAKLKEWERFDNRILVATPAQPASPADALMLRDCYCTRTRVSDDLAELFRERTRGVARRIVVNLQAAQRIAAEEGLLEIDAAWWGNRPVQTGDVAARRREAA